MTLLLRKIKSKAMWMDSGDVLDDLVADLALENGELSIWDVGPDREQLNDVVTAIACTRDRPQNLDYALMPRRSLEDARFVLEPSAGNTLLARANERHFNIVRLDDDRVLRLIEIIKRTNLFSRVKDKNVSALVAAAVQTGDIDRDKLKPSWRSYLGE